MEREEAIRRIKAWNLDSDDIEVLSVAIPELRESEDERIRKEIIEVLRFVPSSMWEQAKTNYERCFAYLEKQKEQKPKFYPGNVIKCTSTGSLWVRCKDGDNIRSDGHTACIGGGYELASKEEAVQFFQELNENGYQWDCIKGRPMKKEQKPKQYDIDVLEKHITRDSISELAHTVIVRNGWEIVEAEQKPAEKQDYSGLNDLERAILRGFLAAGVENVPVGIIKDTAKECMGFLVLVKPDPVEWNKATINGEPIPTKNQSVDIPLAEWSEEDADMLNCCISSIEEAKENRYAYKETDGDTSYDREIDWLKSLSLNLKKKNEDVAKLCSNEWSKEDEAMIKSILFVLESYVSQSESASSPSLITTYPTYYKEIDWLKSLRPQPHTVSTKDATKFGNLEYKRGVKDGIQSEKSHQWKPSEEQMKALIDIIRDGEISYVGQEEALIALKNKLKKLM